MRELERARFGSLFATPLLSHVWADSSELNPQLRESNLEYAHRNPGKTGRMSAAGIPNPECWSFAEVPVSV